MGSEPEVILTDGEGGRALEIPVSSGGDGLELVHPTGIAVFPVECATGREAGQAFTGVIEHHAALAGADVPVIDLSALAMDPAGFARGEIDGGDVGAEEGTFFDGFLGGAIGIGEEGCLFWERGAQEREQCFAIDTEPVDPEGWIDGDRE